MSQFSESTQPALDYNSTIIGALELSERKWVLAVQLPGISRHSRHVLDAGGDELAAFIERLKARCAAAGRKIARVILTHEAGRDGFWLARFLGRRGIEVQVIQPSSLPVDRRARRAKTDIIDVEMLLRTLMAWLRGEPRVIAVHPKLLHYGLTTGNLSAMLDWYRKVLGMTVNHRSALPAEALSRAPFSAMAFISNDETDHRIVLFEVPGVGVDRDKGRHARLQHVAFACRTLDDLLGTFVRLKRLGILPVRAADHGLGTAFYYADPDQNIVELSVNNYGDDWTATEHLRTAPPGMVFVDPDKMLAARKAGASPWEVHEQAVAGNLAPDEPQDPRAFF